MMYDDEASDGPRQESWLDLLVSAGIVAVVILGFGYIALKSVGLL